MDQLIITLFCMYGIMFTLRESNLPIWSYLRDKVLRRLNIINELLSCSFCTGFHAGWLTYLLMNYNALEYKETQEHLTYMIVYGFVSATFCYFFDIFLIKIEKSIS